MKRTIYGCPVGSGFTRCYIRKRYGSSGFRLENGKLLLKVSVLKEEKARLKKNPRHNPYIMKAVNEAINFKHKR